MRKSQIEAQGRAFEETGGFTERLTAKRVAACSQANEPAPTVRSAASPCPGGGRPGGDFWGCSAFPDGRGTPPGQPQ